MRIRVCLASKAMRQTSIRMTDIETMPLRRLVPKRSLAFNILANYTKRPLIAKSKIQLIGLKIDCSMYPVVYLIQRTNVQASIQRSGMQ